MKGFKKVVPLILALVICFTSTGSVFAATSTKGGTWYATDIVTDESVSNSDIPLKIVYLPYSEVCDLLDAAVPTDSASQVIAKYGKDALTAAVATAIAKKYAANLVPYVGLGLTVAEAVAVIQTNKFNKALKKAKAAGKGMVLTVYQAGSSGEYLFKTANWSDGKTMPAKIYFSDIDGYVKGTVSIGEYNTYLWDPWER